MPPPETHSDATPRRPFLLALAIAAAYFAAVAPTLRWQDFSGGSENLVVETVLEMHRGGPWLIPTLQGVPRVTKPPLTVWLTAAAVRKDTLARLSDRDPAVREAAFRQLAWQVRWPSLLASCAMLVATYALARNLRLGTAVALASVAACGSTLLFLRFARGATTDVQLALWVTVANALLALAVFRRRPWAGFLGAGVALGLAFMSKGPVAFVQTMIPFVAIVSWRRMSGPAALPDDLKSQVSALSPQPSPRLWLPALAGLAASLLIGLPWFLWVVRQYPQTLSGWWVEVTRVGATQLPADPWYTYFVFFVWTVPWLAWLLAGVFVAAMQLTHASSANRSPADHNWRDGTVASLLLVVVPLVVMSFFKDKNERYTLPMLAPAAVLAARAAVGWWKTPPADRAGDKAGRAVEAIHWLTLIVIAIAVPLSIPAFQKLDPANALTRPASIVAFALAGVAVIVVAMRLRRRAGAAGLAAAAAAPAALMLLLQFPVMKVYAGISVSDMRPLADAVWAQYPDAQVYQYEPGGRTRVRIDLPIYLGRTTRAIGVDDLPKEQADRPQVVVFLERYANQAPQLRPPWKELARGTGQKGGWRAFVLPAAGAQ